MSLEQDVDTNVIQWKGQSHRSISREVDANRRLRKVYPTYKRADRAFKEVGKVNGAKEVHR